MAKPKSPKRGGDSLDRLADKVELLAQEIQDGFGDVADLFKRVDDRFEGVEKGIEQLTSTVAELAKHTGARFDRIDKEIHESRGVFTHAIDGLTTSLSSHSSSAREERERMQKQIDDHEERVTMLEGRRPRRA